MPASFQVRFKGLVDSLANLLTDVFPGRIGVSTDTHRSVFSEDGVTYIENLRVDEIADDADAAKGADLVGYKGRTVRDRLAEPGVSVMDHGAVADYNKTLYTGTNNQAAFQAAADEAASLGVPLIVPPGSYYLGSKFTCSTDIIGGGEICIDHRTTLYNPGYGGSISSLAVAVVWSGTKRTVDGVQFWSPGRYKYDPALSGAVNGGMYCFVLIVGTVGTPSVGNTVKNCRMFGGHYGAVMVGSYCTNTTIQGNYFDGNGYQVLYDNMTAGFKAVGSSGIYVLDNQFRGADWTADATAWATTNQAWGGDPVEINAPLDGTSDIVVSGNQITEIYSATNTGGIGIGLAKCRKFAVNSNFLDRTHHDGIHIEDDSYDGEVTDNRVFRAIQLTGSGAITCEKSYGITFGLNYTDGGISINGGTSFAGPFLPDTTDEVLVIGNKTRTNLFVINQSNVTLRGNEVLRTSGVAPSAGNDGIQITVGPATASSGMKNILVEGNTVKGFYRGIAVTGNASSTISNFRIRSNICPANAASTAPAADKKVYIVTAYASSYEVAQNEDFGDLPTMRYDTTDVPEGVVAGNRGDIYVNKLARFDVPAWFKRSGNPGDTSGWLPFGHFGILITDRTDGTALDGIVRHVRYRGTGGHAFTLPLPTGTGDSGRKLTFVNWGTGAPITITPASGTIYGLSSISLSPGQSITLVNDSSFSWSIESHWGVNTSETYSNAANQYTTVTQTGAVTQQSLAGTVAGSRTIAAGRLNAQGAGFNLYLCGTYTTDATPGNATIRILIGSTTFRTIGSFALDASITDGIWWIRGRITTRTTGATGTVGGQLMWEHQASSVAGSQVLHIEPSTSTADVTVDLTASQTIDVDWTATDAGTSITCSCFAIDLIR